MKEGFEKGSGNLKAGKEGGGKMGTMMGERNDDGKEGNDDGKKGIG
jgi:hypothetical protein